MDVIPRLAASYGSWSPDDLTYTVTLRQGVTFHDGSSFNATVVEWNYNRLNYFTNFTGLLPPGYQIPSFEFLYRWPDGTPIINRIDIVDPHTVNFVLNRPYAPFEALLAFSGSGILSPMSTPEHDYIETFSGDIIGTGPFVYDYYDEGKQYEEIGEYQKAIEEYLKVIKLDPNHYLAWNDTGAMYCNLGDMDKAIGYFQKAIEIDSSR